MKQKEDMREVYTRLEAYREKLIALLKEWPYERRLADQQGYTAALKAWHVECQGEE